MIYGRRIVAAMTAVVVHPAAVCVVVVSAVALVAVGHVEGVAVGAGAIPLLVG